MVEEVEEQGSSGFDLHHYMDMARRRHLHFLIPMFIGWFAVWAASWVLPARYKSGTLILVEQPTMPKDYVVPNVNDDLQERLQSITQQILSRTRLLHIIDQLNLYAGKHAQATPDDKVDRMRKDIDIQLVRDAGNQVTAFNVYYSSHDAYIAQQVTSELTNLFINENLEVRQQMSEDTTKFLEDQLEEARKSLSEQEEKIREFKGQHVGELPTQTGSNLQILSGMQSQLQNEQDALNSAKQQKAYLETLSNQYRAMQGTTKTPEGTPTGVAGLDQQLEKLKSQLADMNSRYTDKHPDVRKLKDQIAKTEKLRDQMLANAGTDSSAPVTTSTADPTAAPQAQVQSQLQANQVEITNRENTIAALKEKVNDYQNRLNQEPVREQQLADLTRGYDQSKANYDELLKKRNQSEMATSMELLQQGERFRILDPPSLPLKPDFPNRLKFCAIGLGAGFALGAVVAGAFEMFDDRIYDEKELKHMLPAKVLCEIPVVATASEEARTKARSKLAWVLTGLAFLFILSGSAISYFRG
jgi:polysaccharide biosynthesis transport protein